MTITVTNTVAAITDLLNAGELEELEIEGVRWTLTIGEATTAGEGINDLLETIGFCGPNTVATLTAR